MTSPPNQSQTLLSLCRSTNVKVLTILNEIPKKDDLTELITTIQLVQISINHVIISQLEFKFEYLTDLHQSIKDYEELLTTLKAGNTLLRIITSSRQRKKVESQSTIILQKLQLLKSSIKEDPKAEQKKVAEDIIEEDAENDMRLALMIEDQDAKDLWEKLFGLEVT
jgi:hypothetical protein